MWWHEIVCVCEVMFTNPSVRVSFTISEMLASQVFQWIRLIHPRKISPNNAQKWYTVMHLASFHPDQSFMWLWQSCESWTSTFIYLNCKRSEVLFLSNTVWKSCRLVICCGSTILLICIHLEIKKILAFNSYVNAMSGLLVFSFHWKKKENNTVFV